MSKLVLRFEVGGQPRVVDLEPGQFRLGRGRDNDLVLPDYSVSRQHARLRYDMGRWLIEDLGSTNGIEINGVPVRQAQIHKGDNLKIGIFELKAELDAPQPATTDSLQNATIIRKLSDLPRLDLVIPDTIKSTAGALVEKKDPSHDSSNEDRDFLGFLNKLARDLIHTDSADQVLEKVMEIAFNALPVERGYILLGEDPEKVICHLMRVGEKLETRPTGEIAVSRTILRTVMSEQVGLLTLDALGDERLAGGKSIVIHGIRAAMCAPLWSGNSITGFIQVDTPLHAGSFSEEHLDFLITLANYAAVGVQRSEERRKRGRLERYHSPSVLEAAMQDVGGLNKREVTVLFGDLVGFTAFSESARLEDVADLLSGYFNRSVQAIFQQGGTLDKFIGDCVMAFFGAPLEQADHAKRAVVAALDIQTAMRRWNEERGQQGLPPVQCRIALNTGPVVVGDIGSEQRVDYTILGNTVNVAARLESSLTPPGEVVIGEAVAKQLDSMFELEELGQFSLKGLQQKVLAYRVIGLAGAPADRPAAAPADVPADA